MSDMDLDPEELGAFEAALEEIAAGVGDLVERATDHPFTCWRPWDAEDCSQLRAVKDASTTRKLAILGGNRSGKTESAMRVFLALVLGADHPDVVLWAQMIGLDISGWPKGPGVGYCVALTNNLSRLFHRGRFMPGDLLGNYAIKWWGFDSTSPAKLQIWVPGYKKPCVIWFRSQDQGKAAFQGDSVRAIMMDEEGDDKELMQEAGIRLVDQNGWMIFSATLFLKGVESWADDFFDPGGLAERTGWKVHRLRPVHNPAIDFQRFLDEVQGDPVQTEIRLNGRKATNKSTIVYPSFNKHTMTYDPTTMLTPAGRPVPPPKDDDWRFRGQDFGSSDPTVVIRAWLADHGILVVYGEYYVPGKSTKEHAMACKASEPPRGCFASWGDQAAAQEATDWAEFGISWTPATRDIKGGVRRVKSLMDQGRLLVSTDCPNLIRELENLKRDPKTDAPVPNQSDHAADSLRYIVYGLVEERWLTIEQSPH